MNYFHYSEEPFEFDKSRKYDNLESNVIMRKPRGLWVSVKTGIEGDICWKEWCEGENFGKESLKYIYEIDFHLIKNILFITNQKEFWEFYIKYGHIPSFLSYREKDWEAFFQGIGYDLFIKERPYLSITPKQYSMLSSSDCFPNWEPISQKYDGIIIAPYLWKERLDCMWYYGWDCASGCIWNLDCIKECRLVEPKVLV